MLRRRRPVQNKDVARMMKKFFTKLPSGYQSAPNQVALDYAKHMWGPVQSSLVSQKKSSRSRYYVGISADVADFRDVTKRVTLVADTLLLSGDWDSDFHQLDTLPNPALDLAYSGTIPPYAYVTQGDFPPELTPEQDDYIRNHDVEYFGMHSPDLHALGRWILESEPLLRAGLTWYIPNYSKQAGRVIGGRLNRSTLRQPEQVSALDYLVRDGRAVDMSGAHPIKSRIVRPILEIDLPFIDGVGMRDFSDITVSEFNSYVDFRSFLRKSLLELDDAVNAVQSEQALMKISADIEQQLHSMKVQMAAVQRRRAVAVSGAVVGTVGAVLAAVYGPAMEEAVKLIAASSAGGGLWSIIDTATSNSARALKEDRWHYVWALSHKAQTLH
jgi:hypothetical protein